MHVASGVSLEDGWAGRPGPAVRRERRPDRWRPGRLRWRRRGLGGSSTVRRPASWWRLWSS